jgi:hypothetical protein
MQTKEYNLIRLLEFGAIRSKLAEMAMNMQMKVLLTELQRY